MSGLPGVAIDWMHAWSRRLRGVAVGRVLSVVLCAWVAVLGLALSMPAVAQQQVPADDQVEPWGPDGEADLQVEPMDVNNPLSLMDNATQLDSGGLSASISIVLLLTAISLAPALLVMCTSFTRIIVVLGLLRQAIGTQSLPPSQVLLGLSLFMTLMIMAPTFKSINENALKPLQANEIGTTEAWEQTKGPLRDFMIDQIEYAGNENGVTMLLTYQGFTDEQLDEMTWDDVDFVTLVPAFVLSELKTAFIMGFRFYLPFLVIDMVVSSVLISMGMMMLPPVFISMPFKLVLFVLVDGWRLVVGNLLTSFDVPNASNFVSVVVHGSSASSALAWVQGDGLAWLWGSSQASLTLFGVAV